MSSYAENFFACEGNWMTGIVGCEHQTLVHQVEHFNGIAILTSRRQISLLDLSRLPKLKYNIL